MTSDGVVKRLEPELIPAMSLACINHRIARNGRCLAHLGDASRAAWRAVEVDKETRVSGKEERRIDKGGQTRRYLGCAKIPRDVSVELGGR